MHLVIELADLGLQRRNLRMQGVGRPLQFAGEARMVRSLPRNLREQVIMLGGQRAAAFGRGVRELGGVGGGRVQPGQGPLRHGAFLSPAPGRP